MFESPAERSVVTKWAHGALGAPGRMPLCTPDQLAAVASAQLRADADHPLYDDVAFFRAMIAFLQSNYTVDGKRIYSTGFSNGGQMSWRLALEMSDLVAAASSSGGGFAVPTPIPTTPPRPTSAIYSIGEKDAGYAARCGTGAALPMNESLLASCPALGINATLPGVRTQGQAHVDLFRAVGGRAR